MEKLGLADDAVLREDLLALYWELAPYKEVPMMLATLKAKGYKTGILSNGSPDMLSGAVDSSGLETYLDAVLSVETVGVFKPDMRVYQMVLDRFNCPKDQVLFVTSNGWDAAGAAAFGFQTAWVNRMNDPVDKMPSVPNHILENLSQIPSIAEG
jgi:2-haloacid dehalogenase